MSSIHNFPKKGGKFTFSVNCCLKIHIENYFDKDEITCKSILCLGDQLLH